MSVPNSTEVTVTEHLLLQQKRAPQATGHFTALFNDLVLSAKIISRSVTKAGLLDILGGTGVVNVQGEQVQKLDGFADIRAGGTGGGRAGRGRGAVRCTERRLLWGTTALHLSWGKPARTGTPNGVCGGTYRGNFPADGSAWARTFSQGI